jgi:hypothetical protein
MKCTYKMEKDFELQNNFQQIKVAVIIAIIIGLVTSVFFLVSEKESYSAIYFVPDSIIHNPDDHSVLYIYAVTLSDSSKKVDYIVDTYIDNSLIKTKEFSLNNGETLEERARIVLPSDGDPSKKITLVLKTGSKSESIHFWVNNITL